jgi:signal transduction histidine kinase
MKQALSGAYGDIPERYRGILSTALAANDDERRIVETLLLVARYEAGEDSNVRERVACGELVGGIVSELQPVAEIKGAELRADVGTQSLVALGDPHEIRRAIVNLVANALDATPRGGRVVVRCDGGGERITITVEDDGYGVPPERRDALFQRFGGGQLRGGTGLGLYIVRRIAEKHGGRVAYAPREPRGSVFTMTLPAVRDY